MGHNHAHSSQTVEMLPAGAKDSHGAGHHGHTIMPLRTLVTVLAILMFFTLLTVGAANAEVLWSKMFDVHIPGWVNVAVALSIAAVKSIIVAMYFMQLRYDNPTNSLVAIFTIMVLTFFLGFTMIDLGNRKAIYEFKGQKIVDGGVGGFAREARDIEGKLVPESIPDGTSIAMHARLKADRIIEQALSEGKVIENHAYQKRLWITYNEMKGAHNLPEPKKALMGKMAAYIAAHKAEFDHIAAEDHGHGGGSHMAGGNTPNSTRVRAGLTPGLLDAAPAAVTPAHGH